MAALHLAFPVTEPSYAADGARICGSSPMAARVREFDWSKTPLGSLWRWPEALVAAVNLVLASPVASSLLWGPELTLIHNDRYLVMTGSRRRDVLGSPAAEAYRDLWQVMGPQYEQVLRGDTVEREQCLVPVLEHGEMRNLYFNYTLSPVYEDGRVAGVYTTSSEVTESVLAERERDRLAERLQQVLASTSNGVVTIDRAWQVTYMNAAALQATAKIPGMLGRNLWASLPALNYEGSPNRYHFARAMDEGISAEFESYYPEPLNHWLCIRVSPMPEGIAVFFEDITTAKREEQKAEEAAAAQAAIEDELRWTVALSAQMPWTANPDGEILHNDASRLTGVGREVVASHGGHWQNTIHPEDRETTATMWRYAIRSGTPYDREHRLLRTDGMYQWYRSRALPRRDEQGAIVKWYGTTENIHARKQTEEALRTSEKLAVVGRMASSIAHEINNPLEAVTNLLYLCRTSDDVPEEVLGYLEMAERELKRASTITSQTLRFHRQSTKQTEVEFGGLIDEVLGVVHGRLVNSSVAAEVRVRTAGAILCFEGEVRQVLLNLTINAIDAMHGAGGRLLIRTREATEWSTGRRGVMVTIADTGPGMSAEVRGMIFDPFFTTKGHKGTGLGLWVSQEIVMRHEGALRLRTRVGCADREGGCGCVFTLFLPG